MDSTTPTTDSGKVLPKKTLQDYEVVTHPQKSTSDLGKGSYGSVKLVKEKGKDDKLYAMKIVNKKVLKEYASAEHLNREIKIQRKLEHPHIIRLYSTFEDKENVYLILEYAENGNLFFYLRKKKKMTEKEAFVYFFQTCIGIDYLHKKGILHRDLKPENLLLDKQGNIKLCDFGWSAEASGKRNTFCGTVDYMAPEMVQNKPHDEKIDIWSLGVLLYELIHGHAPFRGKTTEQKFAEILNGSFTISSECKPTCVDLIKKLLKLNPTERASMEDIFAHPWVKNFEKEFNMKISSYLYDPTKRKRRVEKSSTSNNMEKRNKPINPDSSQLLNDTLNTSNISALDTSAMNFEPLSIKKAGNMNSSFMLDTSQLNKSGDRVLDDLNLSARDGKSPRNPIFGDKNEQKSPSSSNNRTNKFAGENKLTGYSSKDPRAVSPNHPETQIGRSLSPSIANGGRDNHSPLRKPEEEGRKSKSSIFDNSPLRKNNFAEEMKAEVDKVMNTDRSKSRERIDLSQSQSKLDLSQSRLDSSFDKSLNLTSQISEIKPEAPVRQKFGESLNQKLMREMENRIKSNAPRQVQATQNVSVSEQDRSFESSRNPAQYSSSNADGRQGGRSPLKIDTNDLDRISRDINRSKSPTTEHQGLQRSGAQSQTPKNVSQLSVVSPNSQKQEERGFSAVNKKELISPANRSPNNLSGTGRMQFEANKPKQQGFDDNTDEGPSGVADRVSQTKSIVNTLNDKNRPSRDISPANQSPNRGKYSDVHLNKDSNDLNVSHDSSQLNKSFDMKLLSSSKQPQTPENKRKSLIFDKSPTHQEEADRLRVDMGNILGQIEDKLASTDTNPLALKQELSFKPVRNNQQLFENKASKDLDEIPDETNRRENRPRTSDISEKQTRVSASPVRASYKIDPKDVLPADPKKDSQRFSKISDFVRKKDEREVNDICNRIFQDRDRSADNSFDIGKSPTHAGASSSNYNAGGQKSPVNSQLTKPKPFYPENNGFSQSVLNNGERVTVERVTTERITNIEKYIQNYLEDNEELQVLSKLEGLSKPDMSKAPQRAKKGIFDTDQRTNRFEVQMPDDSSLKVTKSQTEPFEESGVKSPFKNSRAGSTSSVKSKKEVRFELPTEPSKKSQRASSEVFDEEPAAKKKTSKGNYNDDEEEEVNLRQFSFGKKQLEEDLKRSFNEEDSGEKPAPVNEKRDNRAQGGVAAKPEDNRKNAPQKTVENRPETRGRSPIDKREAQNDQREIYVDKRDVPVQKKEIPQKSRSAYEENDRESFGEQNSKSNISKDLIEFEGNSFSDPRTFANKKEPVQKQQQRPIPANLKTDLKPHAKTDLRSDLRSEESSSFEDQTNKSREDQMNKSREYNHPDKQTKSRALSPSPILKNAKKNNFEQIEERFYESQHNRSRSQVSEDWNNNSINRSYTDKAGKALTPTLTPQKMNSSFSKQQQPNTKFNYREFQALSQEMNREELLKFYQSEMNKLENSTIVDSEEPSSAKIDFDDDEEEIVVTYEIDTSRSMKALQKRKNQKRAKENAGAKLNQKNQPQSAMKKDSKGDQKKQQSVSFKPNIKDYSQYLRQPSETQGRMSLTIEQARKRQQQSQANEKPGLFGKVFGFFNCAEKRN